MLYGPVVQNIALHEEQDINWLTNDYVSAKVNKYKR